MSSHDTPNGPGFLTGAPAQPSTQEPTTEGIGKEALRSQQHPLSRRRFLGGATAATGALMLGAAIRPWAFWRPSVH